MQPSETFWKFFGSIGLIVMGCVIGLIVVLAVDKSIGTIRHWRWEYKYKHRFDKQPTAKCYCKDCYYHAKDDKCENVRWADRYTPDNGFCYEAEPRKKDIDND